MKDQIKATVVLNKNNSDGFLDLNFHTDLDEVIKALKKLKK